MNATKSHITLILDRSGSMDVIRDDVVGAVNRFIEEQQKVPGECTLTLVQFDDQDPYEVLQDAAPIAQARRLSRETYVPRGNTPLLDAVGKGIVGLGEKLANTPEDQRPGKVIFVVQTDGAENASREYTKPKIAEMIKHQSERYNWQFVFLGANQDAILTGSGLNINKGSSLTYANTANGVQNAMRATSSNVRAFRCSAAPTMDSYSDEQRLQATQK